MNSWKDNRKLIIISCENCDKEFEKTLSEYNRSEKLGRKHFCSIKCNNEFKKKNAKYCSQCNNIFYSSEKNAKFCSKSCSAIFNNSIRVNSKRNFSDIAKKNINDAIIKRLNIKENMYKYGLSPNYCKHCNAVLNYKNRKRVFCSLDCKRIYDSKNINEYQKYYNECKFNLADYPNEFDFTLVEKYG
jgi:hypothetical protein